MINSHKHIFRRGLDDKGKYIVCECGYKEYRKVDTMTELTNMDTNEKIDEILWSAIMHEPAPTKIGEEYKATWNQPVIDKAKQSLLHLIHQAEITARIDELESWTYCGAEADEIKERISALEKEGK